MSDNENVIEYDVNILSPISVRVANDEAQNHEERGFRASMKKRKPFVLTYLGEEQKLDEFLRIQHWANIAQDVLPLDEVNLDGHSNTDDYCLAIPLWLRASNRTSIKTDIANLYSALVSVSTNEWRFEHLMVLSIALTSTLAFSLAPSPSSEHLASQLDFHVSSSFPIIRNVSDISNGSTWRLHLSTLSHLDLNKLCTGGRMRFALLHQSNLSRVK